MAETADGHHVDPVRRRQAVHLADHGLFQRRDPFPAHGRQYEGRAVRQYDQDRCRPLPDSVQSLTPTAAASTPAPVSGGY